MLLGFHLTGLSLFQHLKNQLLSIMSMKIRTCSKQVRLRVAESPNRNFQAFGKIAGKGITELFTALNTLCC